MKTISVRLARTFAAGLVGATLALPLAAAADTFTVNSGLIKTTLVVVLTPEQAIGNKAVALGAAFTGTAVSGLETLPTGFRIRYQNCDIYYSVSTGAHEVHGGIRDKYNVMGGPFGHLGLPRTDELATSDGVGRYNEFAGDASIYWSPNTGPFAVEGLFRSVWVGVGAEHSRFGYPTSGAQFRDGGQWQDFQNDVLYFEGNTGRAPELAGLPPAQITTAVRNLLKANGFLLPIDSVAIRGVFNTGQDFWQSRNRLVDFRVKGSIPKPHEFDPDYTLDLILLFFAQKEADGSTTLRVALNSWLVETSGFHLNPFNWAFDINPFAVNEDPGRVMYNVYNVFGPDTLIRRREDLGTVRPKLINLAIPGAVNLLSFKVQSDGGIGVHLQPNFAGALAQLAIQRELDAAAK